VRLISGSGYCRQSLDEDAKNRSESELYMYMYQHAI